MSDEGQSAGKYGSPSYALTSAERRFLSAGETGTYRESVLQDRIEDKVKKLNDRLNHLLADIQLLNHNGYLDEDQWGESLLDFLRFGESPVEPQGTRRKTGEQMLNLDTEPSQPTYTDVVGAFSFGPQPERAHPTSAPVEMGQDFGRAARQLMTTPEDVDSDDVLADICWGFIRGAYMDHRSTSEGWGEERRDLVSELSHHFHDRLEKTVRHEEEQERDEEEMRAQENLWDQHRRDMQAEIRRIISEENLPLKPRNGRRNEHSDWLDDHSDETVDHGVLGKEVIHLLIDEVTTIQHPLHESKLPAGTPGRWIAFTTEYGPAEEFDPNGVIDRDLVLDIIESRNLVEKGELGVLAQEDVERLEQKLVRGVSGEAVFDHLAENGRASSRGIADALGSETSKQDMVTQICNDLSGRKWDRPVIKGDNSGWELTPYGEVLAREKADSIFNPFSVTSESAAELLDAAADQLNISS